MFKKGATRTAAGVAFVLMISAAAYASEFGCKVLLCLSSPGGARQYSECRATIDKLHRMLQEGKPFPHCTESQSAGVDVKKGYEAWEPCKAGYEQAAMETSQDSGLRQTTVCRKFKGYSEETVDGRTEKIPVYDYYDAIPRTQPHYVEVLMNGERQGERLYYKVNKKKGWF